MYLTDPDQGTRRRARLRHRAGGAAEAMERVGYRFSDRLQDLADEGRAASRQFLHRSEALAEEGRAAGWRLLRRAESLARAGREAWAARAQREPARWRPGTEASVLTAASGIAVGVALGAAAMFLLDPRQRRRRLALARDQALHLGRSATGFADVALRDLGHRAKGVAAQATRLVRRGVADDAVLTQRVRAALGRVVSHPHAIWVTAAEGCVTVGGPVLASERAPLLRCVGSVHGVREVRDALEPHDAAARVPALQGGVPRSGPRAELRQAHWAPGPRLLVLAGGMLLALYGASRRGMPGLLAGTAGLGLAARAMCNEGLGQGVGRVMGWHRDAPEAEAAHPPGAGRAPQASTQARPWQPALDSPETRGGAPLH
ncbi:BON domain-containing protein [uncultured Azohydromonas sp.]|uniref:BON domain-containing protein n=1 Tax=uncultured Azohydromonas sp. TaxID=487342 RepID=UPI00261BD6CC|nr:BON domain-containing protein [uncultured Azohydromonas sp.]